MPTRMVAPNNEGARKMSVLQIPLLEQVKAEIVDTLSEVFWQGNLNDN